MKKTKAHTT